jgi:hypothetical protein
MTAYTSQRKVWYDGTNYWRSYYDEALTAIRFDYSTQARLELDPDDWTENPSARITDIGVSHDFCVRGDSSDLYIVYSDSTDILGRKDSTYPATNFTWAASSVVFDGSADGGAYYRACVAKDAAGTRLNVCAALNVTAGNTWSLNVRRATAADTIPTTAAPTKTLASGMASLQCSTIRRGDVTTAGSLIAVWKEGYTDLKSAYRNGPDNVPAGGDDWEATQSIVTAADCSTEPGNGFTITNVLNTGETLLIYINSDGKTALRTRPPGSSQSWSAEDTLSNTSGDTYPAMGEHALYHFHLVWLNSSGVIVQREYKATTDLYTPSISPYQAPATVISSLGASWLQVSDETPIAYMIWQLGAAVRAYVLGITAVSTTTTSTSTTTSSSSSSTSSTASTLSTTTSTSTCTTTSTPPP